MQCKHYTSKNVHSELHMKERRINNIYKGNIRENRDLYRETIWKKIQNSKQNSITTMKILKEK